LEEEIGALHQRLEEETTSKKQQPNAHKYSKPIEISLCFSTPQGFTSLSKVRGKREKRYMVLPSIS